MALIFANHQQFELACRKFIAKYDQADGRSEDGQEYSSRVLSGWTWTDQTVHSTQGYMTRKDAKRVHTKQQLLIEPEDEELDEEEEDPATASPIVDTLSSITVEWMVLYSKTYRIPQLCFNVYGSSTPLSLSELLSTGIFLQSPRDTTTIHDDHLNLGPGGDPFDTAAQFPLLQKISHPYPHAGSFNFVETVWSIHPCHVQDSVAEVLVSTQTDPRAKGSPRPTAAGSTDGNDHEEVLLAQQVAWLECWFMITSTLMDLRR
ncbi:hypothetical protein QFC20_004202 [Naganishia adeliensis]|uniref:Uncharacterized protein n=1 Tax=Naganishia adeliensis TaxID=92952 RepID=A0ACC2W452_9TREE|nr:hypothetical protein QFC20_004202 [Naganishia adeliensis]